MLDWQLYFQAASILGSEFVKLYGNCLHFLIALAKLEAMLVTLLVHVAPNSSVCGVIFLRVIDLAVAFAALFFLAKTDALTLHQNGMHIR